MYKKAVLKQSVTLKIEVSFYIYIMLQLCSFIQINPIHKLEFKN